jgi:hypothetical protein
LQEQEVEDVCTLGAIDGRFLFKNRDMEQGAGIAEDLVQGYGRFRYVGVAGHASPLERGLNSGMNEAGVAVAITFVDHAPLTTMIQQRTPRGVLVEEILRNAGDLASALRIAADFLSTTPLVGGNIVILTPKGGAVIEQIYPKYAIEMITQPITVRTNHFLNLKVGAKLSVNKINTEARFDRFTDLLWSINRDTTETFCFENLRLALADHKGLHPICRHDGDALVTVSTVIYDIEKRILHYVYGNPCNGSFSQYSV